MVKALTNAYTVKQSGAKRETIEWYVEEVKMTAMISRLNSATTPSQLHHSDPTKIAVRRSNRGTVPAVMPRNE